MVAIASKYNTNAIDINNNNLNKYYSNNVINSTNKDNSLSLNSSSIIAINQTSINNINNVNNNNNNNTYPSLNIYQFKELLLKSVAYCLCPILDNTTISMSSILNPKPINMMSCNHNINNIISNKLLKNRPASAYVNIHSIDKSDEVRNDAKKDNFFEFNHPENTELPIYNYTKDYCLVLDMDETLIHFFDVIALLLI